MGVRGTINHLIVSDEHRSHSAGSALMSAMYDCFRDRNVYRVFLFCDKNHVPANRFWLQQGFKLVTREWAYELDL